MSLHHQHAEPSSRLMVDRQCIQIPSAAWDASEPVEGDSTPWWSVEAIKSISFQNNRITEIPKELFTLSEVATLNLSSNELRCLPQEVSSLKDLRTLLVAKNKCEFGRTSMTSAQNQHRSNNAASAG
jgi:Leucine rich repeat